MNPSRHLRSLLLFLFAVPCVFCPNPAHAQPTPSSNWNNFIGVGTTWSTAANWLPAGVPTPGTGLVLGFGSSTLQTAGGYTSTFTNGGTAFDLNSLVLTSLGASNPSLVITGNAGGDTLQFDTSSTSVLPSIWQVGTGRVLIQNGSAATGITLTGTTLQILGNGIGELQLGSGAAANLLTIGETAPSGLLINQTGTRGLLTGSQVRLGGSNNFSGGVNLTAGNLVIANAGGLGLGTLTINGGTVQFDPAATTTFNVSNAITLNATMILTGANTATTAPNPIAAFNVPIGGAAGITLSPINGTLNYSFLAANTFSGPLTIQPLGNTAVGVTFGNSTSSGGAASGASGFTVYSNSTLTLDNRAGAAERLNTVTAPTLTLNRGNLNLFGNSSANVAESFGTLTVGGTASISVLGATATAQTTTAAFAGFSQTLNGTISFTATNLGSGTGNGESIITFATNPGGAIGGAGGPGTTTISILPYAFADSGANTAGAASLAPVLSLVRWNPTSHEILPLNLSTEYASSLYLNSAGSIATANQRYASSSVAPNAFGLAGLIGSVTANALVLDTNTATTVRVGLSADGPGTLTLTSGTILAGVNGSTGLPSIAGMINLGGLNFGAAPGYIHTVANLIVNSPISGSGGLVKSGFGTLVLNGANSFTGGLTLNSGILQFNSDANLGAAGQGITLNSGLSGAFTFQPNALFNPTNVGAIASNRPITIGSSGTNISVAYTNSTLTLGGTISGSGQFLKSGAGILALTGSNTFTGNLVAAGGTLAIPTDSALGDPSAGLIFAGSTFQPTASFTSNWNILMTTGTPIILIPAGVNWTVSGNFTSQTTAATPLKDGPGDLTLTGVNTFTGGYQNGISGPAVRGTAISAAANSGRTILSGANGSMPLAASVLSLENGEVVLDNSTAVNNNRIGSVTVGLIGGNVRLIGNSSAPVNEAIGALSINNGNNQYGGTLTLVTPAGSGQSTTLTALNFTNQAAPNVGTLFVRGTNLGAASGDRTAVVFGANPAQTNGLIAAMVGAASATSDPTDFLTTTTITVPAPNSNQFALTTFTAYTPSSTLTATAGSATATYDVTTAVNSLAAASAANALRISPGGSIDLTGSTMALTSGAILAAGGANGGISNGALSYAAAVPARFTVAAGSDLTVTSTITGTTGGLVKTGGGVLTLSGAVSMTTGLIGIGQGTLRTGAANVLPAASLIYVNAGATLDLNGTANTIAGLNGYGTVNIGTGGTLTLNVGTAPALGLGGPFVGDATSTLVKTGAASQTVNGNSTSFSGAVNILNGTLVTNSNLGLGSGLIQLGDISGANRALLTLGANVTSFSNPITIPSGSTPASPHTLTAAAAIATISSNIAINNTAATATSGGYTATGVGLQLSGTSGVNGGNTSLTGTISGPGGIYLFSGNWSFDGNNTFAGGIFIDAVTTNAVGIGVDSTPTSGVLTSGPFGTGTVAFSTGFGSNLRADGGPRTIGNQINLSSTGGYFGVSGTNPLTLNGPIDFQNSSVPQAFYIMNTATTTMNGPIQNGTAGVAKNGPGVLVVTGANTYSGTTTVNSGTLLVNNSTGSGTGSGAAGVVVNFGAILGGNGTIGDGSAAPLTFNTGAIIRPGASLTSIGTLTVNSAANAAFSPGSIFQVNVGASPSVGGKLSFIGGGTADLSGLTSIAPLDLYLTSTGGLTATPYSMTVMDSGATGILFPGSGFNANLFSVTTNFGLISPVVVTNPTAGTIVLNFTPVPEPTAVISVCAGAAGLVGWLRRRHKKRRVLSSAKFNSAPGV